MLDPRIYRMGLIPIVLAVIVLAFSLTGQQGPLSTTLAPDAYSGSAAFGKLSWLARQYPYRHPGSSGDRHLAGFVASALRSAGFQVWANSFEARTAVGTRQLENVVGLRAGQQNGSIVVVSHRDALSTPDPAQLSGTATMLELASVLNGETLQHTVILASTSGSDGAAGAQALARSLPQPVDAAIVLGDMSGTAAHEPIVVPWSGSQQVAPPVLRNTVAAALSAQTGLPAGSSSLLAQLAHLALPMAATEQAPFGVQGEPAVLLSLSGEQAPSPNELPSSVTMTTMGRTLLETISALDGGSAVPAPSSYLSLSGKSIPAWAVRLLVLALIVPVLMATIDGFARARRRGSSILRWLGWVLSAALPFALAGLLVLFARAVNWIAAAPPGPLGAPAIRLHSGEFALLGGVAVVIVGGLFGFRRGIAALAGRRRKGKAAPAEGPGAAAAVLLALCAVVVAVWFSNPFAAILLVPALHLWMWVVVPDVRLPAPAAAVLLLAGLALPALVALEYATVLGLGPLSAAWSWILLIAGGGLGFLYVLESSVFLGCVISVIAIAIRAAGKDRPEPVPVTIRGPVTYAGPGSLGGTKSALHR
jgi:hypothetical protein